MNLNSAFDIIITSMALGVRFIPIISISEVFGGKYVPLLVRSSLIGILGFFRYFYLSDTSLLDGFSLGFLLSEFFCGFIISLPYILLVKFIINTTSTLENLFGGMGILNSQGIFDERGSAFEMLFEMIIISIILTYGVHLDILKLIMNFSYIDLNTLNVSEITNKLLINFNILSKNAIGYFLPIIIMAFSSLLLMAFSDILGTNLNFSFNTYLVNSILILVGIIFFLKNIADNISIDILRIRNLANLITGLIN